MKDLDLVAKALSKYLNTYFTVVNNEGSYSISSMYDPDVIAGKKTLSTIQI